MWCKSLVKGTQNSVVAGLSPWACLSSPSWALSVLCVRLCDLGGKNFAFHFCQCGSFSLGKAVALPSWKVDQRAECQGWRRGLAYSESRIIPRVHWMRVSLGPPLSWLLWFQPPNWMGSQKAGGRKSIFSPEDLIYLSGTSSNMKKADSSKSWTPEF